LITAIFKDIKRTTYELENKLELSNNIINFLNNRSKEELKYLNVTDRTNFVMDSKRVLAKWILMYIDVNNSHDLIG
jgi:hypothetical protein